jgi:hypothetical protein
VRSRTFSGGEVFCRVKQTCMGCSEELIIEFGFKTGKCALLGFDMGVKCDNCGMVNLLKKVFTGFDDSDLKDFFKNKDTKYIG